MSNVDAPEPTDWRMYYARDPGLTIPVPGLVQRLGEIDQFNKATFVLRLNDVGSFVIDADPQATGIMAAINDIPYGDLARNIELVINGRRVFLGPIQGYERRLDHTHERVAVFGADQNVFLAQRVCLPQPAYAHPYPLSLASPPVWAGSAPTTWTGAFQYSSAPGSQPGGDKDTDDFTGPAGQAIHYYVEQNIGLSSQGTAAFGRAIDPTRPRLAVSRPGPAIGNPVTITARFQNLLELVQGIAVQAGDRPLAFAVQAWGLAVWQPVDLGAIFSTDIGNIQSYAARYTVDDMNTTYTAGQGEGRQRQIVITHGYGHNVRPGPPLDPTPPVFPDLVRPPIFGRVEAFRDRRDTNEWPTLVGAGLEDCRNGIKRPQVSVSALDTPTQRYGRDYDLGDLVTVRIDGTDVAALVTAVTFNLEPGRPPTVTPTLGTETAVAPLGFIRRLDQSNSRINQLERR